MPQSLANILVHLVTSTKDRAPTLTGPLRAELFPYTAGVLRNLDSQLLQIGGVEDHIHILFRLPRTLALATIVEKLKANTSRWIKVKGPGNFAWQAGYGAFSVSHADADAVTRYIQNQPQHHEKTSFQEELRKLLADAGMAYDEQHLWD